MTDLKDFQKGFKEYEVDGFVFIEPSIGKTRELDAMHKQFMKQWKTDVDYYATFLTIILKGGFWNKRRLVKEIKRMTPEQLLLFFKHVLGEIGLGFLVGEKKSPKKDKS